MYYKLAATTDQVNSFDVLRRDDSYGADANAKPGLLVSVVNAELCKIASVKCLSHSKKHKVFQIVRMLLKAKKYKQAQPDCAGRQGRNYVAMKYYCPDKKHLIVTNKNF